MPRHFRIFIDAATLKRYFSQVLEVTGLFAFPHLYRCGHIEAARTTTRALGATFDFRIFIDAATLKHLKVEVLACHDISFPHLYRCGHIEARASKVMLLFDPEFPHLYRCGHIEANYDANYFEQLTSDFRIFIDAATLKLFSSLARGFIIAGFPHLYRCGHIEADCIRSLRRYYQMDFRIYIDAATLKHRFARSGRRRARLISASI